MKIGHQDHVRLFSLELCEESGLNKEVFIEIVFSSLNLAGFLISIEKLRVLLFIPIEIKIVQKNVFLILIHFQSLFQI